MIYDDEIGIAWTDETEKERFTGTLLTFYSNGMILESTDYRDGMRCGEHKRFYKDGVLMWRGWYWYDVGVFEERFKKMELKRLEEITNLELG